MKNWPVFTQMNSFLKYLVNCQNAFFPLNSYKHMCLYPIWIIDASGIFSRLTSKKTNISHLNMHKYYIHMVTSQNFSRVFFFSWPNSVHLREHGQYYNSIIFFCLSVRHYYSGKCYMHHEHQSSLWIWMPSCHASVRFGFSPVCSMYFLGGQNQYLSA